MTEPKPKKISPLLIARTHVMNFENQRREHARAKLGSLGAASDVRRIDPKTGKVIEVIKVRDER